MKVECNIRIARIEDLPAIVNIYNQSIYRGNETGDLDEFSVQERIDWFNKFDENNYPIYVADFENQVIGYCSLSPYRSGRRAMSSIAEISYYLATDFQGKGIGTELIQHAITEAKRIGKESLLAILLDVNKSSVGILEKFNFKQWGHFPDVVQLEKGRCGQLVYGLKLCAQSKLRTINFPPV